MAGTGRPTGTPKTGSGTEKQAFMVSPRSGARIPTGNHPGNTGGKKGRSGPKPREFKDFLKAEIRDDPKRRQELANAAGDRDSRGFAHAWKIATDYDDEKPAEKKQIAGKFEIIVRMTREGKRRTAG